MFLCIIVIILVLAIIMLVIKMICVHKKGKPAYVHVFIVVYLIVHLIVDVTDSYKDRRGTDLLRAEVS